MAQSAEALDVSGTLPEDYLPSLKPILQTARQRSPQTIAAEIEIALYQARADVANAPRLPQLSANLNYAINQTAISGANTSESRDQGLFYSVNVNQALFHWGALKNQSAIAAINVLIAEKSYDEAYRLLTLNLRQLYLALVAKKAALTQTRYALGLLEANLALDRERLARGMVAQGQIAVRELNVRETKLQLARQEADFAGDRGRFARVAGISDLTEDAIPGGIPKPTYSAGAASTLLTGLMRDGAKTIFEAQIIELRIREAERRYAIEKVRLRPKVYASAGTSLENATTATSNTVTQQGVNRQSVSVNAQWYIFDGHATRGAKMEASTAKRQQERRLAALSEETVDRIRSLERQLAIDAEAMEISEIHRGIAALALNQTTQEFNLGNAPKTSVSGAESGLLASEANNAGARATFLTRWSELVSLAGVDPIVNVPNTRNARQSR